MAGYPETQPRNGVLLSPAALPNIPGAAGLDDQIGIPFTPPPLPAHSGETKHPLS